MVNIDDIKARLSKDTLEKVVAASQISKDFIPTPSFGLNLKIGGGVPIGKQTTIVGNQSAGKSILAIETAANAQRQDRGVAYFDVEKTFDPDWARRLGADPDQMIISRISTFEEFADMARDYVKAGVELIVTDSVSELQPSSYFEKDGEDKGFAKTGQMGSFSKEQGQAGKMILGINFTCALVQISQVRKDLSGFMAKNTATQGNQAEHQDSLRIKIFSSSGQNYMIPRKVQYGNNLIEEMVGRKVTWSIEKNKVNGGYGSNDYDLYFRGDTVGVDKYSELVEFGKDFGIIEGANWMTLYGEKMQGKAKLVEHLRSNPEVADKLEAEILANAIS